MSEPENFLTRWSRRKSEAVAQDAPAQPPETEARAPEEKSEQEKSDANVRASAARSGNAEPAFDPTSLPPIESIVAGTDITAFLRAGVPAQLTRAALRRAWAADPNIRDYVGLSENSWDFTAPGGVPGFGPLSPEDAGRLMAEYTGKLRDVANAAKQAVEQIGQPAQPSAARSPNQTSTLPVQEKDRAAPAQIAEPERAARRPEQSIAAMDSPQRDKANIAAQNNRVDVESNSSPTRRPHGSALPK
jgi:hypothetical protein